MSQVTIYLPSSLEKELRRRAKDDRKSLSAYIAELARRNVSPRRWPEKFASLYGSCKLTVPEDPYPEEDFKL